MLNITGSLTNAQVILSDMPEDTSTIEVDPDELSDQVVESLVEEGAFTPEEAENHGDEIWFEEVETPEPTKQEGVYDKVSTTVTEAYGSWRDRTAFIDIESVEKTNSGRIRLNLFHPDHGEKTLVLSVNSSTLGNLMALAGIDNPKQLENGRVVMNEGRFDRPQLVVPNNLSSYGRTKYKMYSLVSQIQEKTNIKSLDEDSTLGFTLLTLIFWIPACLGALVAEISIVLGGIMILPALLLTALFLILSAYGLMRAILVMTSSLLDKEVTEVEIRN